MDANGAAMMSPNVTHRPRVRQTLLWGTTLTAFLLGALVLTLVMSHSAGAAAVLLAAAISTTVIGIVVPLFVWVDRLESEPAPMLWFAFGWGSLIATTVSIG